MPLLNEPVNDGVGVRHACAEHLSKPVPSALYDLFTVSIDLELAPLAGLQNRSNPNALFDFGRETRGLADKALSSGAMNDLDGHRSIVLHNRAHEKEAYPCDRFRGTVGSAGVDADKYRTACP